ncbi:MAG: hypothetical protein M3O30_07350 [Planctomycetota bacterium]|nr:hypothetical protein [Planctomycetota bacterium]
MQARRLIARVFLALIAVCFARFRDIAGGTVFAAAPGDLAPDTALPRETLAKIFQGKTGKFTPEELENLLNAHALLERYFAASAAADQKKLAEQISATGLNGRVLGVLAHVRSSWGALAGGVYYINDKVGPHEVRYYLGVPRNYDLTLRWPLVVKLPAANAFLTNPPRDAAQVSAIYSAWINDELAAHPNALVLMPLLNLDDLYGPDPAGMNYVMQAILHSAGKVNIDPARVYLFGHSMGAHAVWNIALHYPTYFAAINPMAGAAPRAWQRVRLGNLRNVLPVIWHDASDPFISVDESREIVRYLGTLKYEVDYDETKDVGHAPTAQIIAREYAKVLSRQRALYPRNVYVQSNRLDAIFNRADWVQIYQPMNPGREQKIIFSHGTQGMTVSQNSWRVIAELTDANTINLTTANVELLRLYLNDQMVDFSKPVKVIANGRERFNAMVPQSAEEMLKDQIFLGRGWRYFTGVIDIDLLDSPVSRESVSGAEAPAAPTTRRVIEYTTPEGEVKTYVPGEKAGSSGGGSDSGQGGN